jgi:hypothetical protein
MLNQLKEKQTEVQQQAEHWGLQWALSRAQLEEAAEMMNKSKGALQLLSQLIQQEELRLLASLGGQDGTDDSGDDSG